MGYASPRRFLNKSYLFIKEYMVIDELSCSIDIDADPGFHFYPQLLKKEKEKEKKEVYFVFGLWRIEFIFGFLGIYIRMD